MSKLMGEIMNKSMEIVIMDTAQPYLILEWWKTLLYVTKENSSLTRNSNLFFFFSFVKAYSKSQNHSQYCI